MPTVLLISVPEDDAGHAIRVREQYATGETIAATQLDAGKSLVAQTAEGRRVVIDLDVNAPDRDPIATANELRELNGLLGRMVDRRRRATEDDPGDTANAVLALAKVPSLEPWLVRLRIWDRQEEARDAAAQ